MEISEIESHAEVFMDSRNTLRNGLRLIYAEGFITGASIVFQMGYRILARTDISIRFNLEQLPVDPIRTIITKTGRQIFFERWENNFTCASLIGCLAIIATSSCLLLVDKYKTKRDLRKLG